MAKVKEIMVLANYLWFRFYGNKARQKKLDVVREVVKVKRNTLIIHLWQD